jgi:hypothetical protein
MKVTDLEKCVSILAHLALERGVNEVMPPDSDGYWTVTAPAWTQVYEEPKLAVGSFSDDEEELKKMLADPARASSVDLERVAHLLRRLSDQLAF